MPKIRPVADNSPASIQIARPGQPWDAGKRPPKVVMPSGRVITHEQWCRVLRKLCRDYQITPRQAATASGAIVDSQGAFDRAYAANNTREASDERKARTGKRGWMYGQKYIHTAIDRQGDQDDRKMGAGTRTIETAQPGQPWGARRSGRFAALQNAMRGGRANMLNFKTAASSADMDRGRAALMRRGLISGGDVGQVGPITEIEGFKRRSELRLWDR